MPKTAVSTAAYYDADVRAQSMLLALDDAMQQGDTPDTLEGVVKQTDGSYAFSVDSSDGHALNVVVDVSQGKCEILSYRYENAETWTGQSAGTLWQGG